MTIIKDLEIYSVNPLYIMFGKMNDYFEKNNVNKYVTLAPSNESKEKKLKSLKNCELKSEILTSI